LRLVAFFRCGGLPAAAPGHFRTRLACGGLRWPVVVWWCVYDGASRGRKPTGVAFDCVLWCFYGVFRCGGVHAAAPGHFRTRLAMGGRLCVVGNHAWPVAVSEMWQIGEQISDAANFAGHSRLSVGAGGRKCAGRQ